MSINRIKKHLQHLEKAKASDHKDNFHQLLYSISEAETRKWEADAALSVKDVGILGSLNPARWIARRRIRKLIRRTNELIDDGHMRDFHAAVQLEISHPRRLTSRL